VVGEIEAYQLQLLAHRMPPGIFGMSMLVPLASPALNVCLFGNYLFICSDIGLPHSSYMISLVTSRAEMDNSPKNLKFCDIFHNHLD